MSSFLSGGAQTVYPPRGRPPTDQDFEDARSTSRINVDVTEAHKLAMAACAPTLQAALGQLATGLGAHASANVSAAPMVAAAASLGANLGAARAKIMAADVDGQTKTALTGDDRLAITMAMDACQPTLAALRSACGSQAGFRSTRECYFLGAATNGASDLRRLAGAPSPYCLDGACSVCVDPDSGRQVPCGGGGVQPSPQPYPYPNPGPPSQGGGGFFCNQGAPACVSGDGLITFV